MSFANLVNNSTVDITKVCSTAKTATEMVLKNALSHTENKEDGAKRVEGIIPDQYQYLLRDPQNLGHIQADHAFEASKAFGEAVERYALAAALLGSATGNTGSLEARQQTSGNPLQPLRAEFLRASNALETVIAEHFVGQYMGNNPDRADISIRKDSAQPIMRKIDDLVASTVKAGLRSKEGG